MRTLYIDFRLPQSLLINIPNVMIKRINGTKALLADSLITNSNHKKTKKDFLLYTGLCDNFIYDGTHLQLAMLQKNFKVINTIRMHDIVNLTLLSDVLVRIKEKRITNVHIPNWYYNTENIRDVFTSLPSDKPLYIKALNQARSVGKHRIKNKFVLMEMFSIIDGNTQINKHENYDLLPDGLKSKNTKDGELTADIFNILFGIDTRTAKNGGEVEMIYNSLLNNNYYIQEAVSNCPKTSLEFRILYFRGTEPKDYVVEERFGYSPNSSVERVHTVINKEHPLFKEIINISKHVGDSINLPAISLDLHYDKTTQQYSIFEYSVQFGVSYKAKVLKKISKQYSKAIALEMELIK